MRQVALKDRNQAGLQLHERQTGNGEDPDTVGVLDLDEAVGHRLLCDDRQCAEQLDPRGRDLFGDLILVENVHSFDRCPRQPHPRVATLRDADSRREEREVKAVFLPRDLRVAAQVSNLAEARDATTPTMRVRVSHGPHSQSINVQIANSVSGAQASSTWAAMRRSRCRSSHQLSWRDLARRKYSWMSASRVKPMPPKIC